MSNSCCSVRTQKWSASLDSKGEWRVPRKQRKNEVRHRRARGKCSRAFLADDNLLLDFENDEAPSARIRSGKTSVDKLLRYG